MTKAAKHRLFAEAAQAYIECLEEQNTSLHQRVSLLEREAGERLTMLDILTQMDREHWPERVETPEYTRLREAFELIELRYAEAVRELRGIQAECATLRATIAACQAALCGEKQEGENENPLPGMPDPQ